MSEDLLEFLHRDGELAAALAVVTNQIAGVVATLTKQIANLELKVDDLERKLVSSRDGCPRSGPHAGGDRRTGGPP